MALTERQRQELIKAKEAGLTKEQAMAKVFRIGGTSQSFIQRPQSRLADIPSDLMQTGGELIKGLGTRYSDIKSVTDPANIISRYRQYGGGETGAAKTLGEMGVVAGGNLIGAGFDVASAPVMAAGRAYLSPQEEETVKSGVETAVNATGLPGKYNEMSPEGQRNVRGGLGFLDTIGLGLFSKATRPVVNAFSRGERAAATTERAATSVDDIVAQTEEGLRRYADDPNLTPRQREEVANSTLTFKERYIGLNPAEKQRLSEMGPEKLQEYLDATHLRNIDDTKPTPYEIGSQNVQKVQEQLDQLIRDTGSDIGSTRQKLATVKASPDAVNAVDNAFSGELGRLKLQIKNGKVTKTPGTISSVTDGDIRVLNDLYQDIRTFKQSPTLANMIDLRMNFDAKINYNKAFRDVSNDVDPLSRAVRKTIATQAENIVGKTNAADLQKYSEFLEAYGDLKSYTKRAAGGEYLLRLVLSGRGGDSRKLIQTIKDYTGVDLMNDATAMKLSTELLGNNETRNLFRQEVTRAGYDVANLVSSGPVGWTGKIAEKLLERGIDVEDVLKNAAKAGAGGAGAYVVIENNPDLAPGLGLMILSAQPNLRSQVVKSVAKVVDSPTIGEMQDFSRVVRENGVVTTNKGELTFKEIEGLSEKQVRNAFSDGLRLLEMDENMLRAMENESPGSIAKFYDEIIAETESAGKAQPATTKTTDLLEEARKSQTRQDLYKNKAFQELKTKEETLKSKAQSEGGDAIRKWRKTLNEIKEIEDSVLENEQMFRKKFQRQKDLELRANDPMVDKLTAKQTNELKEVAKQYKDFEEFASKIRGSATQYGDYTPKLRKFVTPTAKRVSEIGGVDPNQYVTIYRGIDNGGRNLKINKGDFVTTNFDEAAAYTDSAANVAQMRVRVKDLIEEYPDDFDPETFAEYGSEFIYQPDEIIKITDTQLEDIWKQAN